MAPPDQDAVQKLINKAIDDLDPELRKINRLIHENPELCYEEFKAHDNVTAFLRAQGLEVTPHAFGLQTSFLAEYGHGGRVVTFNVEYDALPGIGHACGHNLICMGSLAAFLGVVAAMKEHGIAGRVRALGTPAEEGGGGKIKLIDAGAYEDVDACLMTHPFAAALIPPMYSGVAYVTNVASAKFGATFTGKPAHAAAAPHQGVNALDAAVLAYNGLSMLRQQIKPDERIQVVILKGGDAPNIITPNSVLDMNVRSSNLEDTLVLKKRVLNCFEGAAKATGCTVEFSERNAYAELVSNPDLCVSYSDIMAGLDAPQLCAVDKPPAPGPWSSDMGNVSKVCPGFHATYSIPTPDGAANHTHGFTAGAATDEAHRLTILTSKGMAGTAWKMLTDDGYAGKVKASFENGKREGR